MCSGWSQKWNHVRVVCKYHTLFLFITLQAVLECLQRLSKQSGLTLVDDEHLNVTLKQAQSKDILISVFGRFNAGKSTLLNAVMADGYVIYPI